ncbi:ABC transporter substrate-binding protein [Desulfallas sp. Bu1-1]|uniref:ABC transporter substrate-binding protein n=1 Tax=Desulfallas sp. Bu1-1 TaxID=2787620 RepID=UPI0018A063A4|nr:ABC transporter substrate-binding protein [Desulfallas sp. Bu1-1]MBF7083731.1 ABC transporter substrate-binding protein [Desulfallas sp. Bu1-1]
MIKPKTILGLLLITSVLLAGGAFYTRHISEKKKDETVTLRVWEGEKSILHLPLYVALKEGYFDEQRVRIKLIARSDAPAADPYIDQVADIILTDPVEHLYRKSVNPSAPPVIATLASRDYTFLLGREKENWAWENLKGERVICYPPETGPGLALEKILRENGMLPQHDLSLYYRIPPELRLGAFKAGSGSYIQLPGPQALQAEASGTGFIVAALGETEKIFPSVLCVARSEIIKKHPEAVQAFVDGIYKARLWMNHEPELASGAAKKYVKDMDLQIKNTLLSRYMNMGMWAPVTGVKAAAFKDFVQMLETAGQIPVPVMFDDTVNNTFATRAAETIKYIPPEEREKGLLKKIFG